MTFVFRAAVLALGVTGMIHSISIAAAPDYSADVARAMRSGDYAQARTLLRERSQAGDAEAQLNLGALLATGRGGRRDPAQAARWYQKAAEQGVIAAQYNMGAASAEGVGVDQSDAAAVYWFANAAASGNERASAALGDLAGRLPTKQVTASQVRVRSAASTSSKIVGQVSEPARVPVLGRTRDGWTMVYLPEQQRLGWIADSLLSAQATPP